MPFSKTVSSGEGQNSGKDSWKFSKKWQDLDLISTMTAQGGYALGIPIPSS